MFHTFSFQTAAFVFLNFLFNIENAFARAANLLGSVSFLSKVAP